MLILSCLVLTACQDSITLADKEAENAINANKKEKGMQRVIASSTDEIKYLISQLNEDDFMPSRVLLAPNLSNNEDEFVSLIEANRQKVMASLTPEQLDSIENDEDELEFCPSDSVIADIRFAQLLNADREIQVGTTVYKYFPNGVAFTEEPFAEELDNINPDSLEVTQENEYMTQSISPNVKFTRVNYQLYDPNDEPEVIGGNYGGNSSGGLPTDDENMTATSTPNGLLLSNGVTIPLEDIRDLDYYDDDDNNWFTKFWHGRWGRNIAARKKFSKNTQLNMNFYDQNYIIYANIGSKLKMQKKKCFIWWNIKAQTMIQGWETVTIKYSMSERNRNQFINPFTNEQGFPSHCWNPFPYNPKQQNILLLTIPFINYDFTTKDLGNAFKAGIEYAWNHSNNAVKDLVANDKDKTGLMVFTPDSMFTVYGPYSVCKLNKRSIENKFYARWWPGTYEFGFSFGSSIKFKKIKIDKEDGVELHRGRVFGAIRYKDKWLAARITKNR